MAIKDLIPWRRHESARDVPTQNSLALADERNPIAQLRQQMDRLFDDFFSPSPLSGRWSSAFPTWPSVEVKEDDSTVTVTAELAGLSEKDVEVLVDNGVLTLRGEKKSTNKDEDQGWSERFYGRFERMIPLPDGADEQNCEANVSDGVLTVTMPKSEAKRKSRRIAIQGHGS
jgi:HSP20 family protein